MNNGGMDVITPLETATDIIDALGGNGFVADLCGVGNSAVSNWRKTGFPDKASVVVRIARECRVKGVTYGPDILDRV